MTYVAVSESVNGHAVSSRLPGGGPVSRRSLRRVPAAAWSWSAASLAVVVAAVVLVALTAADRLDPGAAVVVGLGLLLGGVLVLSWSVGAVREAWLARPLDDVRAPASGTAVALRGGPVPGDDRALAVVEVAGEPAGVLRERPARGRLGAHRTLVLAGRVHTLRHGRADRRVPGHVAMSVLDASGRVVARAARFARPAPGGRAVDWCLAVGDRDLWLRVHRGRAPRRRTLLDDGGQAWVSRPRRGGREAGVHGATTELPAELGSWEVAAVAWLLAEIERDTTVVTGVFLGEDDGGDGDGDGVLLGDDRGGSCGDGSADPGDGWVSSGGPDACGGSDDGWW